MTEQQWEKKLKIHTAGREDYHEDANHFPYEPTPYSVLERLKECGFLRKDSILIDYGCGKGRVGIFFSSTMKIPTVGIELQEELLKQALTNAKNCHIDTLAQFVHSSAEEYEIADATDFYFFNPFPVTTLKRVLGRILHSYYQKPRLIRIYFYYPQDDYVSFLMSVPEISFLDEINCHDLFEGNNPRERILVFEI